MTYVALCFCTPALFLSLALSVRSTTVRHTLGPLAIAAFLCRLALEPGDNPALRLLFSSVWLLFLIKGWSLLRIPREELKSYSLPGLLLYSYPWPGVDPAPFKKRGPVDPTAARWFCFGFPTMCGGIAGMLLLALNSDRIPSPALEFAALAGILTTVHLGYSDVLSSLIRVSGFPVRRLFRHPLLSDSLANFWSDRWNRPFVEMNRLLIRPLLGSRVSKKGSLFICFLISGLLHELALSYPARAGWGGPLTYFLIQGCGMLLERRWRMKSRIWTWAVVLLPTPLLFHAPFRETLVLPFMSYLHSLGPLSDTTQFFTAALTAAAYGHFLVLMASFQVPHRLNWREELQRLRPLNRKLLWTYGCYIACLILAWGLLTLYLLPEMLAGEKSALALMGIIAAFWWSRIVIDAFYFEHDDWPTGVEFVYGHTCLTSLFVTIASVYSALLARHLF